MKKFLVLAMAAALCVPVGVVSACTPKAKTLDLMKGWEKNKDEESQYKVQEADSKTTISYEKTGSEWQYLKHTVNGLYEEGDLKLMKTVVMEGVYAECSNGNNAVTLKFEYLDNLPAQEVHFWMDTTTTKTYEWDVSELQLDKALRMLIFLDGESQQGKGKVEITKFHMTDVAISENANKMQKPQVTIDPVVGTLNTITAENKKVGNWYGAKDSRNRDVYTIAASGTDTNVTKKINNGSTYWLPVSADVKGAELKKLKSFSIKVKGDAVKFKVEGSDAFLVPKEITLNGTNEDTVTVAINNPTGLDANKTYTVKLLFAFFSASAEPKFTIKSAEFGNEVVEEINEITADNLKITKGWYDNDGGIYSIVNENGAFKVDYKKTAGQEWTHMYSKVKGEALKTVKKIKFVVVGTAGRQLLIKPFDKFEKWVDLDGTEQTIEIDIAANVLADLVATNSYKIVLMPEGGKVDVTGTFTIKSCEFIK